MTAIVRDLNENFGGKNAELGEEDERRELGEEEEEESRVKELDDPFVENPVNNGKNKEAYLMNGIKCSRSDEITDVEVEKARAERIDEFLRSEINVENGKKFNHGNNEDQPPTSLHYFEQKNDKLNPETPEGRVKLDEETQEIVEVRQPFPGEGPVPVDDIDGKETDLAGAAAAAAAAVIEPDLEQEREEEEKKEFFARFGQVPNNFDIDFTELKLRRFYSDPEGLSLPRCFGLPTVEAQNYLIMSPAMVDKEINSILNTLEAGHEYNAASAYIGVKEPRPELLIDLGFERANYVKNRLATELVLADKTIPVYQPHKEQFCVWRRWSEIHSNPVIFGLVDEVMEDNQAGLAASSGSLHSSYGNTSRSDASEAGVKMIVKELAERRAKAQGQLYVPPPKNAYKALFHLRPRCAVSRNREPMVSFIPVFQPSVLDDHFFLLALSAAVAADQTVLGRIFASVEHLDKGLITVRLLRRMRIELENPTATNERDKLRALEAAGLAGGAQSRRRSSIAKRRQKTDARGQGEGGEASERVKAAARDPQFTVVTIPEFVTIDTIVPASKTTTETIAPSDLDVATGRTYDVINEFWVTFLEKAYATAKGSYSALHGGSAPEVLCGFFLGDPCYVRWNDQMFYLSSLTTREEGYESTPTGGEAGESAGGHFPGSEFPLDPSRANQTPSPEEDGKAGGKADGNSTSPPTPNTAEPEVGINTHPTFGEGTEFVEDKVKGKGGKGGAGVGDINGYLTSNNSTQNELEGQKKAISFTGANALRVAGMKKVVEEVWWLLREAVRSGQPVMLTNTNYCKDSDLDEDCAFGTLPPPIKDYKVHLEKWQRFNWSYGVSVLSVAELDTSVCVTDPYLRAIRRRNRGNLEDVRKLIKVRSVYPCNLPEYSKLRGEWSLPRGGGRSLDHQERFRAELDAMGADVIQNYYHHEKRDELLPEGVKITENEGDKRFNGGNENWTLHAQDFLQYNVEEVEEKTSEVVVWWMTIDEICRHFNCFATVLNISGSGTSIPRALLESAAALRAEEINLQRRNLNNPFKGRDREEQRRMQNEAQVVTSTTVPAAVIAVLKSALFEDSSNTMSDTVSRWTVVKESPAPSVAAYYYPHFLLCVDKADEGNGYEFDVPENADANFRTIFDVRPNSIDLGAETDDEQGEGGIGGTLTTRTGSAVDIGIQIHNALQVEIRLTVPRHVAAVKDFTVLLFRVNSPVKQHCNKVIREGVSTLAFPIHNKVHIRKIEANEIIANESTSVKIAEGGIERPLTTSTVNSSSSSSSFSSEMVSNTYLFESEVNVGYYNLVICPYSESGVNLPITEDTLAQVSIIKRQNAENYNVSFVPLN